MRRAIIWTLRSLLALALFLWLIVVWRTAWSLVPWWLYGGDAARQGIAVVKWGRHQAVLSTGEIVSSGRYTVLFLLAWLFWMASVFVVGLLYAVIEKRLFRLPRLGA